jgi:oligoribonuclease NrnB/cAMP/cGMP phosphodiesterase (DHH superfamily)
MIIDMDKKILIIYHRVDYDGLCSMSIAKSALNHEGVYIETFGFNYGDVIPDIDELISSQDQIYLVDISFPTADMLKLANSGKAVWIDHHITQITESQECGYSEMPGVRVNGTAACELCWSFFYPDQDVPLGVLYMSHYDTWRHDIYSWDDVILPYQYGLRAEYSLNAQKFYSNFESILRDVDKIMIEGNGVLKYLKNTWKGCVKGYAFDVLVAGKYKGICMLTNTFGSSQFDSVKDQYDCYICVNRKEPNLYNFSIYTNDNCDFNAGEFMKSYYGGGGHKSAAGGKLSLEQFTRLIHDCVVDGS